MPLNAAFAAYRIAGRVDAPVHRPDGCTFSIAVDGVRPLAGAVTLAAEGVVRIRVGDSGNGVPDLAEARPPADLDVGWDETAVTVAGGGLHIRIDRARWRISVTRRADGTPLWASSVEDVDQKGRERVLPLGLHADGDRLTAAFEVDQGERFLGLGEKFTHLDKTGLSIVSSNSNAGGATSEQAYKNVPFAISTRGYGVFFNTTCTVRHEVANPTWSILSYVAVIEEPALDLFVIDGPTPKDVLLRYGELTGYAPPPPLWTYGLWLSRFYYESWDTLFEACQGMRDHDIPSDVVNTDTYWMGGDRLSDMQWDEGRFPDPAAAIARLRDLGFRLCVWEYPYLSRTSPLWREAWGKGYLVRTEDGQPCDVQTTLPVPTHHMEGFRGVGSLVHVYTQPLVTPGTLIDFTNPDAVAWWQDLHRARLNDGVSVFKTDFGEDVPRDARFHDGRTGREVHNLYPLLYHKAVAEVTAEVTGDYVVWGRSSWAGGQRFPIHWGGDPVTTFAALASTVRAALSYGLSGVPFWSHDIGGFAGPAPAPALFVRWAQFGLMSSHARLHGTTPREPWEFGEQACAIFRDWTRLRYRLLPYLYALGVEAGRSGLPLMRAPFLEFPDDPTCRTLDTQYCLGPDLLIAPVTNERGDVEVYLPDGIWAGFPDGGLTEGGRWLRRQALPLADMPVYLRADGVLPLAPPTRHTGERWDSLTFEILLDRGVDRVFTLPDGATVRVTASPADGGPLTMRVEGPHTLAYHARVRTTGGALHIRKDLPVGTVTPLT